MAKVEEELRRFLDNRWRRLIVIIVSFGIGLLTVWPAADEYTALRERRLELFDSLTEAQQQASELSSLKAEADERNRTLAELESQTVPLSQVHRFRSRLVELTRRSGCRVRKIQLGVPRATVWYEKDNPRKPPRAAERGPETPFQLQTQPVTLSASGSLNQVKQLLAGLHDTGKMMHTKRFNLRPMGPDRKEIVLELELILFHLQKKPANAA